MPEASAGAPVLEQALQAIQNELGVPQPGYPAPVANAAKIASDALRSQPVSMEPKVDPRFPNPEGGFLSPLGVLPGADPNYLYRTASLESAREMAEHGLGVVQNTWGDGITQGRAYFSLTPRDAAASVPNDGTPVLIRVPARGIRREEYAGGLYRTDEVPAREVEVLGADGKWYPLRAETDVERDERVRYEAAREMVPERPRLIILKDTY